MIEPLIIIFNLAHFSIRTYLPGQSSRTSQPGLNSRIIPMTTTVPQIPSGVGNGFSNGPTQQHVHHHPSQIQSSYPSSNPQDVHNYGASSTYSQFPGQGFANIMGQMGISSSGLVGGGGLGGGVSGISGLGGISGPSSLTAGSNGVVNQQGGDYSMYGMVSLPKIKGC